MTLRDRLVTRRRDPEKERARIARIARRANGPAAKQIAWEAFFASQRISHRWIGEETVRLRFEEWWRRR